MSKTEKELQALVDAAEKYASIYDGDERECIKTDVLNAFYHGAHYQKRLQNENNRKQSPAD